MNPRHVLDAQKTVAEARGISVKELRRQVAAKEVCNRLNNPGCLLSQVLASKVPP
jgi:hypothetical protein